MHFITEDELRTAFREAPFDRYELTGGRRLTPGARGFLFDRKIPIVDPEAPKPDTLRADGERQDASLPEAPAIRSLERFLASLWEGAEHFYQEDNAALEWFLLAMERSRAALAYLKGEGPEPKALERDFRTLPEGTISIALFTHPKGRPILILNRLARESAELAAYLEEPAARVMGEVTGILDQGILALYGGDLCQK